MTQKEIITEMHTDIKWIKKSLEGNGSKGLIARVSSNEKWRYTISGALILLSSLFCYGIITIV